MPHTIALKDKKPNMVALAAELGATTTKTSITFILDDYVPLIAQLRSLSANSGSPKMMTARALLKAILADLATQGLPSDIDMPQAIAVVIPPGAEHLPIDPDALAAEAGRRATAAASTEAPTATAPAASTPATSTRAAKWAVGEVVRERKSTKTGKVTKVIYEGPGQWKLLIDGKSKVYASRDAAVKQARKGTLK